MRSRFLLAAVAAPALLAGCTVGPNYHQPDTPTPPAYVEPQATPAPGAAIDPARWWRAFGDPMLDQLVERALATGPDIRLAASRIRESRYQEIVAGAVDKPTANALAGYDRLSFGQNVNIGQALGGGSGSRPVAPAARCRLTRAYPATLNGIVSR